MLTTLVIGTAAGLAGTALTAVLSEAIIKAAALGTAALIILGAACIIILLVKSD